MLAVLHAGRPAEVAADGHSVARALELARSIAETAPLSSGAMMRACIAGSSRILRTSPPIFSTMSRGVAIGITSPPQPTPSNPG
jgi:hypothetical protein